MRIAIKLHNNSRDPIILPIHYNHIVQGFIYRHLHKSVAHSVHDKGFPFEKRRFRLFTFSRLFGRMRRRASNFEFTNTLTLHIASPYGAFLESLAEHLVREKRLFLGKNELLLKSVEIDFPPESVESPITIKPLSPVTTYSTLTTGDGRRKTYYYSPWENEFAEHIYANLLKKLVVLKETFPDKYAEADIDLEGAHKKDQHTTVNSNSFQLKPIRVTKRDEKIMKYKSTIIKGWTGIYELTCPPLLFRVAHDCGIGSKNPQGFGMIRIYKKDS